MEEAERVHKLLAEGGEIYMPMEETFYATPHRHPYDEVQFVREGRGLWTVNGEEFEAGAGDILVVKAGEIGAAEAIGLARPAVERALRERLALSAPPAVGTLSFARSADGNFYVAEVLSISTDGVRARFLRGSEHLVTLDQLRPCTFIPGEQVVCNWPWWGPWTCTIVAYDAVKHWVELSDGWGFTESFPIAEIWLAPARDARASSARTRVYATLIGAGAGLGALVGSIITALLMR